MEDSVLEDKTLFSTRDIIKVYPNNVGLQKTLSQFINQIKLRPSKSRMLRHSSHLPQVKVSFYNIEKLKNEIETYIINSAYKSCAERREKLKEVLVLINNKMESNKDTQEFEKRIGYERSSNTIL